MEKRIEYQGMTSQPSDYVCPDGDMKLAVNAEYRDGGWKAVKEVKNLVFFEVEFDPIFIHKTDSNNIYIGINKDGYLSARLKNCYKVNINKSIKINDNVQFNGIGNLLIIKNENQITILQYKEGLGYEISGINLKLPDIRFYCERHFESESYDKSKIRPNEMVVCDTSNNSYPKFRFPHRDNPNSVNLEDAKYYFKTYEDVKNYKERILSMINSTHVSCLDRKIFMFPVILKFALKLYDGTYAYISDDILLFPFGYMIADNAREGLYGDGFPSSNASDYRTTVNKRVINYESYKIKFEIVNKDDLKALNNGNTDIIQGISFFLSNELYTIDLDDIDLNLYIPSTKSKNSDGTGGAYLIGFKWEDYTGETIPQDLNKYYTLRPNPSIKHKDFYKELKNVSTFFRVKEYSMGELLKLEQGKNYLFNDDDNIKNYIQNNTLSSTNTYVQDIIADYSFVYNQRLLLAKGRIKKKWNGIQDYQLAEIINPDSSEVPDEFSYNTIYPSVEELYIGINKGLAQGVIQKNNTSNKRIPVLIGLNNSVLNNIYIKEQNGKIFLLKAETLRDCLWGSKILHCIRTGNKYAGTYKEDKGITTLSEISANIENDYDIDYDIISSESKNPFSFNDSNSIYIGNGDVLCLSTNSLSTSQGQFGQYPLYAFCTDGVYSIGIGTDGTLQNCVPLSYDILTDKHSVGKMEQIVVFATREGIIALSGSERKVLLSADKEADYTYDNDKQKDFITKTVNNVVGITPPQMTDLYTYITTGVRFAFDANHGRLIAFNPAYDYSYIMDAKTNNWGVFYKGFDSVLNIPEQCLLVRKETNENGETEYNVYDYSSDDVVDIQKSYFITRPFKLDMPDVHKSIQSIIQRGVFCDRKDVQQALYGSNDLYNWTPVWSSKDIYLRGMRGSGYKYYKLAIFIPEFKQDEILHGCSVEFTPRLTNKPR